MAFNLALGDPFAYTYPGALVPFTDTTGRTTTSAAIDANERTGIFIIDGQSLGGCHTADQYTVLNPTKVHCVNWAGDRLLYQHKEPMMGPSFWDNTHNGYAQNQTSIWGRVGDLLYSGGVFQRVIWLNISMGGVNAASLAPGGAYGKRIQNAFYALSALGIKGNQVTAILSMQGESDASTDAETYKASRRATTRAARSFGFTGKHFIPRETYVSSVTVSALRQAQLDLSAEAGYAAGPDIDTLTSSNRQSDDIHLNSVGGPAASNMWYNTLRAAYL